MKVTFETAIYGKIECERYDDGTGHAYFFLGDLPSEIDKSGDFKHIFTGTKFTVHWPSPNHKTATLDVWRPREIGRV